MNTKNEQNEFENYNRLYLESSAFEQRKDMIINDPDINNIEVVYDIVHPHTSDPEKVNPDNTETVKEGAKWIG